MENAPPDGDSAVGASVQFGSHTGPNRTVTVFSGPLSPPPHPSERSETTLGSRSGSAPSVAAMNEIAQRKLAERRRRIATIRQRVAAAALVTFALAWGVIVFDGSTGSTSGTTATTATSTSQQASVSVAATDDSSADETGSTDTSSSTDTTPMVTSQS